MSVPPINDHDKTEMHMTTTVVDMWSIWVHLIIQQIMNMYYDKLINFSCLKLCDFQNKTTVLFLLCEWL